MSLRIVSLIVLYCVPAVSTAASAVKETNFSFGTSLGYVDLPRDNDAAATSAHGGFTLPASDLFGISVTASRGTSYYDMPSDSCDSDGTSAGLGLFAREPTTGRVGANYARSRSKACISDAFGTSTITYESESYGAHAEYYFEPLTLGVTRSRSEVDEYVTSDLASIYATWYPNSNVAVGLSVGALDVEDVTTLRFEYQPTSLDNATSLSLSFTNAPDTHSVTVSFTYFFYTSVDLKTRDRRYR